MSENLIFPYAYQILSPMRRKVHKPFFSIIIITLNEEFYLNRLLESINNQSFSDYEIIVSDSSSDDNTKLVAENQGCIVVNTPKSNPAVGRHVGTLYANGEYYIFLDADSFIDNPYFLQEIYNYITINDYPAFLTTNFKGDNNDFWTNTFVNTRNYFIKYGYYAYISGVIMIIRNDIYKDTEGFDIRIIAGEDVEYIERLIEKHPYHIVPTEIVWCSRRNKEEGAIYVGLRYLMHEFLSKIYGRKKCSKWGDYVLGAHENPYNVR